MEQWRPNFKDTCLSLWKHHTFRVSGHCERTNGLIYNTKIRKYQAFDIQNLCTGHAKKKYSWIHNICIRTRSSRCQWDKPRDPFMERSLLPATVGAHDVVALGEEAASHQRHGALDAGETLAVPLALLKRDVLGPSQTCAHQTNINVFP